MLRPNRVEQMLRVLVKFRDKYSRSYDIEKAHIAAMEEVAQERRITKQTVQDMCTRCLGLSGTIEFRSLIEKWMTGNPKPLLDLLKKYTPEYFHTEIEAVIMKDTAKVTASSPTVRQLPVRAAQRLHENFSFSLEPETAKKLKVLSVMEGISSSDWLQTVVSDVIEERYKLWLDSQR